MWLPALNISTLEPHSDVNHSRVESTKDAACLESQPLDERPARRLAGGLALLPVSPLTAAAVCSVNSTPWVTAGRAQEPVCSCPSAPVSHQWKNTSQLATAKPTHISTRLF